MAILSHSPHVCHFALDVAFSCLLRYDLKLKADNQERPTLRHGEKRTSKSKGTKNF